ncbi:MAG: hypothetical protein HYT80_06240 [Euryarchaeota archaeon]|nr:hypothetical protein [Euryarchaeota archaeon]
MNNALSGNPAAGGSEPETPFGSHLPETWTYGTSATAYCDAHGRLCRPTEDEIAEKVAMDHAATCKGAKGGVAVARYLFKVK